MNRVHAFAAVAILLACQPASAAEQKDFRDWNASCDNLRDCNAYGFDASLSGATYLRIERGGAPFAPAKITLALDANDGVTFTLKFNDPTLPGLPDNAISATKSEEDERRRVVLTDTVSAETLIGSIRKAEKIIITRQDPPSAKVKSDPVESEISMSGAVAALLWIDEQQKRLDTMTALIRKGDKPASAVPPQPKPPVIVQAKTASGTAPAKTAPALIAKGRDQDLVSLGIQTDLLQAQHRRHPAGTADAGDADPLPFQIRRGFNFRAHHQIGLHVAGKSGENL
jgi:hypothetical protein